MRYIMSLSFILAGILHFIHPKVYLSIMPDYLPFPIQLIYISGVFEILSGSLLLFPATRIFGAWLTIFTLVVVFPANIQMAVTFYQKSNPYLWIALLRLPLQFALIWWAWIYTKPHISTT